MIKATNKTKSCKLMVVRSLRGLFGGSNECNNNQLPRKKDFRFWFVEVGRFFFHLNRQRTDLSRNCSRLDGEPSTAIGSFKSHGAKCPPFLEQQSDGKILFRVLGMGNRLLACFKLLRAYYGISCLGQEKQLLLSNCWRFCRESE